MHKGFKFQEFALGMIKGENYLNTYEASNFPLSVLHELGYGFQDKTQD